VNHVQADRIDHKQKPTIHHSQQPAERLHIPKEWKQLVTIQGSKVTGIHESTNLGQCLTKAFPLNR